MGSRGEDLLSFEAARGESTTAHAVMNRGPSIHDKEVSTILSIGPI